MSMFQIFKVSGSAISAQSQRLNVVASNLANADTVAGPDGAAYKARQVVFQTVMMGQGIVMAGHNAMADAVSEPATGQEIDAMEQSIRFVVEHMPSHGDYVKKYCPASA